MTKGGLVVVGEDPWVTWIPRAVDLCSESLKGVAEETLQHHVIFTQDDSQAYAESFGLIDEPLVVNVGTVIGPKYICLN